MTFMDRASALYQRGDAVRAAFVLAEAIKRNPSHEEAVAWFLRIYVEDVEGPGLEQEVVRVIESQPEGESLMEAVCSELKRRQEYDRLSYLNRVRQLRRRAAEARKRLKVADPLREIKAVRGTQTELPVAAPPEAEPSARPPRRSRSRRRRRATPLAETPSPQGVLPLMSSTESVKRYSWDGFSGVTDGHDAIGTPSVGGSGGQPPSLDLPNSIPETHVVDGESLGEMSVDGAVVSPVARMNGQFVPFEETDDDWSFSGGTEPSAAKPTPRRRGRTMRRRKIRRTRPNRAIQLPPKIMRGIVQGVRWAVRGKRGFAILAMVALLGATGATYRACTNFVSDQLAEAGQALDTGYGEGFAQAVELYAEYLSDTHTEQSERRDFAVAVLAADYGYEGVPVEYPLDEALSVYGASAVTLSHLIEGNVAAARPEAEELVQTYSEHWISYWTRGRIAMAEEEWQRAANDFQRAREITESNPLPLVGLIDLGLRAGTDEHVEQLLTELEAACPEHPLNTIVPAVLAVGIDPFAPTPQIFDEDLDSEEHVMTDRARELIHYIRAREALAAWQLDQVGHHLEQAELDGPAVLGVRVNLLHALMASRHYRLDEVQQGLANAARAVPDGSPSDQVVSRLGAEMLADLGRADLALEQLGEDTPYELFRAELLVESGYEDAALTLLGDLMECPENGAVALRILVDFHIRRGVPHRAEMRSQGLSEEVDVAYAGARLAAHALNWEEVRGLSARALELDDQQSATLLLHSQALSELGLAELAIEEIDARASQSILVGFYDRARLDVLVISGRAPRTSIGEFVDLLEATEPTSISVLTSLAHAYERIGDVERANETALRVLEREGNNRQIHALLGRIYHQSGNEQETARHLRAYLTLAPETEPTDWAREILGDN